MTSPGQYSRHRRTGESTPRESTPLVGVAIGVAVGFMIGAVVEIMLLADGWRSTFEESVYPISFMVAIAGVVFGGLLLLGAERVGDRRARGGPPPCSWHRRSWPRCCSGVRCDGQ